MGYICEHHVWSILGSIIGFIFGSLGYLTYALRPAKRNMTLLHAMAIWMSLTPWPRKLWVTPFTFHKKQLERPSGSPAGVITTGMLFEFDHEYHSLFFRMIESRQDRQYCRIEINRKQGSR